MNHYSQSKETCAKSMENYSYSAKNLTKVYDKESKRFIFKSTDVIIKRLPESIKIYFFKKNKENLLCHLCLKHTFVSRATDIAVPRIDSCRVFGDPVVRHILLSFPNPGIANEYELAILKERENFSKIYANISYLVSVTNKINETIKETASVCVSGLTTGAELKVWIEKEFNFIEIHMPKYLLQLRIEDNVQTIKDDIPLLVLYEHMSCYGTSNNCSDNCYVSSKAPLSPLSIYINLDVIPKIYQENSNMDMYSIEEKWGANMMPNWLMRLLSDLYYNGPSYEGVFRLSGKDSALSKWYKHMLTYDDFLITEDIYNKAAILKYFLRKIKGSLMTKSRKKEFNQICKKFIKITAEQFLENEKNKIKLIKIVQSLPKTHLFLLQNILIVIQALIDSEKTLFKPFSIARAISPSIFPLLDLSLWKYLPKLFEAIILLTNTLVNCSTRHIIIENFVKYRQTINNCNTIIDNQADTTSLEKLGTTSLSSEISENSENIGKRNSEDYASDSDLDFDSSDNDDFINDKISSDESELSLDIDNNKISIESPMLIVSDNESDTQHNSPCKTDKSIDRKLAVNCLSSDDEDSSCSSSDINNGKLSKNICMGVKMKEIYHSCGKSLDLDLSADGDNCKENVSVTLRHKSLIKPENLSIKELNRSASTIVTSPRFTRIRHNDNHESSGSGSIHVNRRTSRKTLSAVEENNSNTNVEPKNRSRSPNVKNLIKMYEEKNKLNNNDDINLMERSRRNSRLKDEFDSSNGK